MSVRVRFAPSPTGLLHVGALRTALFVYLFAKHNRGKAFLRIEDTDRTRFNPASEPEFLESLNWAGISFDEGPHIGGPFSPYRQSERKEQGIYNEWIEKLISLGGAYKAFDTPEELDEMREVQQINKQPTGYFGGNWRNATPEEIQIAESQGKPSVIRLKVRRDRTIVVEDLIRGKIEWDSNLVDDAVLIKADGMPTYHFASMVDDHLMGTTHIIRGEEWVSSSPKHVELFDLFGWERPVFVHCPVIVGSDGKKLSKRHGATRVLDYAAEGYLPEALNNFVALIGWSPGDDRESMSMDELIEAFKLEGLQPSPGRFDLEKLKWLNGIAIRKMTSEELYQSVLEYVKNPRTIEYWTDFIPEPNTPDEKLDKIRILATLETLSNALVLNKEYAMKALVLEQPRVQRLFEFGEACSFFFEEELAMDDQAAKKWLTQPHVKGMFETFCEELTEGLYLSDSDYEVMLRDYQEKNGFEKLGPIVHPTRVALTGRTFGPGLWELMNLLGKEEVSKRLKSATELFASSTS